MPGGLRLTTLTTLNLNCTSFKMTQYHQMQTSAILANLCEFRFRYSRYSPMKSIKWCYLDNVSSPPPCYAYRYTHWNLQRRYNNFFTLYSHLEITELTFFEHRNQNISMSVGRSFNIYSCENTINFCPSDSSYINHLPL